MTAAEYKTLREALGLSQAEAQRFHGVRSLRTIQHWESGERGVPVGAADELRALDRQLERSVAQALDQVRDVKAAQGEPASVALYRYRDPLAYADSLAGREGLPQGAHAALIDRTRRALEAAGYKVAIAYADEHP